MSRTPHRNNITFVMIAASVLVLVRHSAVLLGPDASTAAIAGAPPLGVFILFALSGYLLVPSWQRRPSFGRYLVDRIARLFPALIVTIVLSVILLGALVTSLPLGEYFRDPLTARYLLNLLLNPQYVLPGVFRENPVSVAVNGTLWSLPAQFAAYLVIPLVALIPRRGFRGAAWLLLATVCGWGSVQPVSETIIFWGSQLSQILVVVPCFFVGAAIRELLEVPRFSFGLAAAAIAIGLAAFSPELIPIINWTLTPFAAIAIGAGSSPLIRDVGRFGNPSFGIFLVGFPVQQALIAAFGVGHAWASVAMTVLLSAMIGYVSERCVELPALTVVHRWTRRPATPSAREQLGDPLGIPVAVGSRR